MTTGFPNLFDNLPDKFSGSGFFGSFNTDTKTNDYSYQSKPIRGKIKRTTSKPETPDAHVLGTFAMVLSGAEVAGAVIKCT